MIKKHSFLILAILFFLSCANNTGVDLLVYNTIDVDRKSELVEIPIVNLSKRLPLPTDKSYVLKNKNGEIVPYQITYDDKFVFQSGLKAHQQASFHLSVSDSAIAYTTKVEAKHRAERYGDMTWENDCVGFRFYGKALEQIQTPTSGLDLWFKRTNKIILDKWYQNDISQTASYHVDHGEGFDPYAVGRTLGGGSMSPYIDGVLHMNKNYQSYEIIDNGPLRATFKLTYSKLLINGDSIAETRVISLDAGSQLTKIVQEYSVNKSMIVAAGFSKRATETEVFHSSQDDFFIYEEPYNEEDGQIFLGIIIEQGIHDVLISEYTISSEEVQEKQKTKNLIATTTYEPGNPVTYYTGFGWSKFGFETLDSFKTYVKNYSVSLKHPFIIKYKK